MTTDILSQIIDYETGELSDDDSVALFAQLVSTGLAWSLQGSYGRTAQALIANGYIDAEGQILNQEGN